MRAGATWYQRRPQVYLDGVQGMPAGLHAVYSVVLDLLYMHGGSINNDPRWISQHSRRKRRMVASRRVELYPGRSDLADMSRHVVNGW